MPSLHDLLHVRRHSEVDEKSPRSPRSPIWPRSPKSPKSPSSPKASGWSKTEQNHDYLMQCAGCSNVEKLIKRLFEQQDEGAETLSTAMLHNSFAELDDCAHVCQICQVWRQALMLDQVTFDEIEELRKAPGKVRVRWEERTATGGVSNISLKAEVGSQDGPSGLVNCSKNADDIGHLRLSSDSDNGVAIEQAKAWLNNCLKNHVGQCDNLRWSSECPPLLIEIYSHDSIRLVENHQGDYVALSYCWGDVTKMPPEQKKEVEDGKTYMKNKNQRLQPFKIDTLPQTVRDALRIIHAMGIRYAWIDTLCIVQDHPDGVATMHKIYSNALFTLCSCATTRATSKILDTRPAWTHRTEPCRLGGQWLTTPDMSLNELRLRSPLVGRAWTLQEERLSPRMLYISANRMHWSCSQGDEMEMHPTYDKKPLHRPAYAPTDRIADMPLAQEFLLACYNGTTDLHAFWADIVKSYAARSMSNLDDRLTALSGLAAKYLGASKGDEYLAGIWAKNLAEGLAWRVVKVVEAKSSEEAAWPSWSWTTLPLETSIETGAKSARSKHFRRVGAEEKRRLEPVVVVDEAIKRGEQVTQIRVAGRLRPFWSPSSHRVEWSSIRKDVDGAERFSFAASPEQDVHSIEAESGRILVYEDRKKEVVGQIDFRRDVERVRSPQFDLFALELDISSMLLLVQRDDSSWRRVGAAWDVREDYFASAREETLTLK